jgi:hypothetical protein
MATKLEKPVKRELEVSDNFGVKGPVIVTMYHDRIEFRRKGSSRKLSVEWGDLNKVLKIPHNAPARFFGNPLGWLVEVQK